MKLHVQKHVQVQCVSVCSQKASIGVIDAGEISKEFVQSQQQLISVLIELYAALFHLLELYAKILGALTIGCHS